MAFPSLNGGFGQRRRGGGSTLSEINVTPFVDVVLVLLIIFMLTAHVMEFGLEVDVPKVRAVKDSAQELPVVTITKDGMTMLNENPVNINDLDAVIHERFPKATGAYVRADKETIWDTVAQVTAAIGQIPRPDGQGNFQVNMVTQPEDTAAKGPK
jgi:biopolymer transport protein ExbD